MTKMNDFNPTPSDAEQLIELTDELARRGYQWPCGSCCIALIVDPDGAETCTHLAAPQSYEDMLRECYAEGRLHPKTTVAGLHAAARSSAALNGITPEV